jgi:hypothetical protein
MLMGQMTSVLDRFATHLTLGAVLDELAERFGGYDLVAHHQQGEFHHDVILSLGPEARAALSGGALVVATNCNGGVKEILLFSEVVDPSALWHARCPDNPEFSGELPALVASLRTVHWFDPCELLDPDARSELKPEHRRRQRGGGWEPCADDDC